MHVVSPEDEKERLRWEGLAEKGGFKSGTKERVGDGKLRIIKSMTVSGINDQRLDHNTQSEDIHRIYGHRSRYDRRRFVGITPSIMCAVKG